LETSDGLVPRSQLPNLHQSQNVHQPITIITFNAAATTVHINLGSDQHKIRS